MTEATPGRSAELEGDDPAASEPAAATDAETKPESGRDPARVVTLVVLFLSVVFFLLYVRADRVMPFSQQARVSGLTVSVAPQISGYVTEVAVDLHEEVHAGQVLVRIDTTAYQIAVRSARAALDNAIQQLGVQSAGVESAAARLAAARAQEEIARRDNARLQQISERNAAAVSQSDRDRAEAALTSATAQVESAEAELRRAQAALGVEGEGNPVVRSALAALEQAEYNLARTEVTAPSAGVIESLELDVGHFAGAGQALMTFVSTSGTWIEADFRENNLANLERGGRVLILFDVAPGTLFEGAVQSIGFGVSQGLPSSVGQLPQVSPTSGWLRQPQQFPVVIDVTDSSELPALRIGAQVSVMVFTGDHPVINFVGRRVMGFLSLVSYVH